MLTRFSKDLARQPTLQHDVTPLQEVPKNIKHSDKV